MSGINYFLDTNAIIALLNENKVIVNAVHPATWLGLSVINITEFLSFNNLTPNDRNVFNIFLQRVSIINLSYPADVDIINTASSKRISAKLKLPDAVITASAILNDAILITNDKQFANVSNLQILTF